jgi:P4 family phage/plasmid primase-like protien
LNIIKEYPDNFWLKDYYTKRIIKTISKSYNLDNGIGDELYEKLQLQLNEKGGIPSLNEMEAISSRIITLIDDEDNETKVDLCQSIVRLVTDDDIPITLVNAISKFYEVENVHDSPMCPVPIRSDENTLLTKQSSEKKVRLNVHNILTTPRQKRRIFNNSKGNIKLKKVYKSRVECKISMGNVDMLPEIVQKSINTTQNTDITMDKIEGIDKSVSVQMQQPSFDNITAIILDISTFFDFNKKFKTMEKSSNKVADFIANSLDIVSLRDTGEMYYYDKGIYKPDGDKIVIEFLTLIFHDKSCRFIDEVVKLVRNQTYIDRSTLDNKELICLENCTLNIKSFEILPHSPKHFLINKLNVKYDSNADCPKITKFLNEVLFEDDVPCMEELVGFSLLPEYKYHKAFMLHGEGGNGKSTFINLMIEFVGEQNISSQSLHALLDDRFATATLYGKLLNVFADIPSKALHETVVFKTLTGEDMISAQHKFLPSFNFKNNAKLIFSANKIPESWDISDAFYRRWIIITFPNQFYGDEADDYLLDKLTTPEEMSGLLNLGLTGLKRLIKNGKFSGTKGIDNVKDTYVRSSDSPMAYCGDNIVADGEGFIPKNILYESYCDYCKANKLRALDNKSFGKKLHSLFPAVETSRPTIDGDRQRCWVGISFSSEDDGK